METFQILQHITEDSKDKMIAGEVVLGTLPKVSQTLFLNDHNKQLNLLFFKNSLSQNINLPGVQHQKVKLLENGYQQQNRENILCMILGLGVCRKMCLVTGGLVPKEQNLCMLVKAHLLSVPLPCCVMGTAYHKYDPIFFHSIGNSSCFRCLDRILIDGNDKGISKMCYSSCNGRDQSGPLRMDDSTWLMSEMHNPLVIGQYVDN
ncbi:SET domain-containing protein 9 [Apodemus sylvaticus]|uniref:SET domain-containing protein 9 n=1 Tax=Apodemus sylvaticus TaxID=10129 RepID=UPI0022441B88|nr:SET domain-containing protein 9 [Apodemus sylvaticus]